MFKLKPTKLSPLTYIDRDKAEWKVEPGNYLEDQEVIRITVKEDGAPSKSVVFYADDADMLIALIEQAKN